MKNQKRTAAAIYVTFVCMMGCSLLLGILLSHPFFIALFFWRSLLAMILISRGASQALCRKKSEKILAIVRGRPYPIKKGHGLGLVLLIALPFYYVWFWVTFLSCINPYGVLVLDLPVLILSFLAFGHVSPTWKDLDGKRGEFWGMHIGVYLLIRVLGWLLRATVLAEFYGVGP